MVPRQYITGRREQKLSFLSKYALHEHLKKKKKSRQIGPNWPNFSLKGN